jgi:hypothetical protein
MPIRPTNEGAIPNPTDKFVTSATALVTQNPQNPHFIHRKRAIAKIKLATAHITMTAIAVLLICKPAFDMFATDNGVVIAVAALAMSMSISHAVRQPCRCIGDCSVEGFAGGGFSLFIGVVMDSVSWPNDERMHHYQRRRTSFTGLVL